MKNQMIYYVIPFAVIENVVTHADYRNKGYASALLERASEIARERRCYKVFLETGSNKESTLIFYEKNGFEMNKKYSCLNMISSSYDIVDQKYIEPILTCLRG